MFGGILMFVRGKLSIFASIFTFLLLGDSAFAGAPDTTWTRTFGVENPEVARQVRQLSDGGFVMAGWLSDRPRRGNIQAMLIRTDEAGNEIWRKDYGDTGDDRAMCVRATSDDGIVFLGYTRSYGAGDYDAWLVKTDSDGNELWSRTFGDSQTQLGKSLQETADGGFALFASHATGEPAPYEVDTWFIRTDSEGNEVWRQTYEGMWPWGTGHTIQETSDGGFVLFLYDAPDIENCEQNVVLLKTDALGNEQFRSVYGCEDHVVYPCSIVETREGGYMMAIRSRPEDSFVFEGFLMKSDSEGKQLWRKLIGAETESYPRDLLETSDGDLLVTGQRLGDTWLVKTDSEGEKLWEMLIGGDSSDAGWGMVEARDGGVVIAGETESYGAGREDAWLIKVGGDPPGEPCDLKVELSGYPESLLRGEDLTFDARVSNACEDSLAFDRAVMDITGPASVQKPLYDGAPYLVSGSVSANVALGVPSGAPLGTYTVEVTIYRDGEVVAADAFEVDVSG